MLSINNLSKSFYGRVLFKNITYNLPTNTIIALVGANGTGKTTLLNILCGLEDFDSGEVNKSKSLKIGYLPQEPNPNPKHTIIEECMSGNKELFQIKQDLEVISKKLEAEYSNEIYEQFEFLETKYRTLGGYSFEYEVSKVLLGLGFKEEQLTEFPKNLSGGWRMRLELAKLLVDSPDFLILDEPTNHLDLPSIIWIEKYLKTFKGTILFVSHDESLLNSLPKIILHLKGEDVTEYHGNYDDFLLQYELKEEGKTAELKNLQDKINHASRFVERFKATPSKAAQARSRMKMIARLEGQKSDIVLDNPDSEINIKIPLTQKSGKEVLSMQDCFIGYDKPLVKNFSHIFTRAQKVAIIGANGLGKSTLIKTIIKNIPLLKGDIVLGHNVKLGYYAQDQLEYLDAKKTVLENLQNYNHLISGQSARKILGSFLFRGDDIYKEVFMLSGGEKSRLGLACLLVQDANFLLLDEPTNHLDILSTEILQDALCNYEGTVMFVSHNRKFIDSVATHTLLFSDSGKLTFTEVSSNN